MPYMWDGSWVDELLCATCGVSITPFYDALAEDAEGNRYLEHFCSFDCREVWMDKNYPRSAA